MLKLCCLLLRTECKKATWFNHVDFDNQDTPWKKAEFLMQITKFCHNVKCFEVILEFKKKNHVVLLLCQKADFIFF